MGQVAMAFRQEIRAFRKSADYGLENALAKWVRQRFQDKTVQHVGKYFTLSETEAAKVVYATASKNTLNKILHHKNGGAKLFVALVMDVTGYTLEQYIAEQAHEAEREAARWQAEERRLAILEARVSGLHRLPRKTDQQARPGRTEDARLGSGEDGRAVGEPRSFDEEHGR